MLLLNNSKFIEKVSCNNNYELFNSLCGTSLLFDKIEINNILDNSLRKCTNKQYSLLVYRRPLIERIIIKFVR